MLLPGQVLQDYQLSNKEKQSACILIASANQQLSSDISNHLTYSGYPRPQSVSNFSQALEQLNQQRFTHLICTTNWNDMQPADFIKGAHMANSDLNCIAIAPDPDVDEMFELLIASAKAYTAIPQDPDDLDRVVAFATKGLAIPPFLLKRQNRRQAVFAAVLTHLDLLAEAKSQVRVDPTMAKYLPMLYAALGSSVETAIKLMRVDVLDYLQLLEIALIKQDQSQPNPLGAVKDSLAKYQMH